LGRGIFHCRKLDFNESSDIQLSKLCNPGIGYQEMLGRLNFTDQTIRDLSSKDTLTVIPSDYFCDDELEMCMTVLDGTLLYRDYNHLSKGGSILLAKKIEDDFVQFIPKNTETYS
jgi:hypothetical protein